jgi:phage tail sheath protein FI
MAGVIAQTDLTIGVHKAPANVELAWAQDVTTAVDSNIQGILNPLQINCTRLLAGRGLRIYGARTLSSDTSWLYINIRRLLMLIEKSVEISTQWSVFEPNDYYLRQSLVLAISSFLESLWKKGALSGGSAADSFFVKCDEENNPPGLADLGQPIVEVGVAPTYPAEFVIFRIGRTKDALEITE